MFSIPRFHIPRYTTTPLTPDITVMQLILRYVMKYRGAFIIIVTAVVVGEAIINMSAYVVKLIIDALSRPNTSFGTLLGYMGIYGAIMIVGPLLWRVSGVMGVRTFPVVRRDIRADLFVYLHKHSHRYFANHFG